LDLSETLKFERSKQVGFDSSRRGIIPSVTISSKVFHALSNSLRLLLLQFGTTSAGEVQSIRDSFADNCQSKIHSLFTRFILKDTDVFPRFANGIAGLLESIIGVTFSAFSASATFCLAATMEEGSCLPDLPEERSEVSSSEERRREKKPPEEEFVGE
jgi:hypothetical protein